jgi:hypothetical protein
MHCSTVYLDNVANHRQTDAKTPVYPCRTRIALRESLKNVGQELARDALPGIAH